MSTGARIRFERKAGKSKPKKVANRRRKPEGIAPTHAELFKDYIGCIKDGPRDLARNHKLYASGAKKW